VTRDESQVRVGGLLALDQVSRKRWSCLTIFGTSTGWSKREHPGEVEIMGSHPCLWDFWDFMVYVRGMGFWPMGLPMLRPFCNV
jgi:hypothetical protein